MNVDELKRLRLSYIASAKLHVKKAKQLVAISDDCLKKADEYQSKIDLLDRFEKKEHETK